MPLGAGGGGDKDWEGTRIQPQGLRHGRAVRGWSGRKRCTHVGTRTKKVNTTEKGHTARVSQWLEIQNRKVQDWRDVHWVRGIPCP